VWSNPRPIAQIMERLALEVPQRLRTQRFHAFVSELHELGLEMALVDGGEPLTLDDDTPGIRTEVHLRILPEPAAPRRAPPAAPAPRRSEVTRPAERPPRPTVPARPRAAFESPPPREALPPITVVPSAPRHGPAAAPRVRPHDYELAKLRIQFLTSAPNIHRERSPEWADHYLQAALRGLTVGSPDTRLLAMGLRGWARTPSSPEVLVPDLMKALAAHEWEELLEDFVRLNLEVFEEVERIVRRVRELLGDAPAPAGVPRPLQHAPPRAQVQATAVTFLAAPAVSRAETPSRGAAGSPTARPANPPGNPAQVEAPRNERDIGVLADIFKD
jgi:hypothetical protein